MGDGGREPRLLIPRLTHLSSRVSGAAASVGIYSPCTEAGHYALKAENDGLTRRTRRDAENCLEHETPIAL